LLHQQGLTLSRIAAMFRRVSKVVLHVEDDADVAFFVRRAVSKASLPITLVRVANGNEAIDYLGGKPPYDERTKHPFPDEVILDLKLPGIDGFDVLTWIREGTQCPDIPVVILTSSDRSEDLQRAKELGVTAYLNKSVSYENLVDFLREQAQ
jgi:CheY-like chemotaxis protein